MFGQGFSTLFRNRWTALVWAVLILWGTYEFVGDSSQDDDNIAANADDVTLALNAL